MEGRVDKATLVRIAHDLLKAIGEDPDREDLQETPRRFADWWGEFIDYAPGETETCFTSTITDQMVCVSGIRVWSICAHHLLPFWCDVAIGYIPQGRVLGMSKFARIAHQFAHRLQLQEHLSEQIADEICRVIGTNNVAVVLKGEHLCMSTRGIRTPGIMTSLVMRGCFHEHNETRMAFLRLVMPHS